MGADEGDRKALEREEERMKRGRKEGKPEPQTQVPEDVAPQAHADDEGVAMQPEEPHADQNCRGTGCDSGPKFQKYGPEDEAMQTEEPHLGDQNNSRKNTV